uniref:EGF-like domain-containing protein n=1 Tax=Hucho hucho TaxID=62062 RepID=A0A4W5JBC9_9TELE
MGQNSPNLLWGACGRLPETLQERHFTILVHVTLKLKQTGIRVSFSSFSLLHLCSVSGQCEPVCAQGCVNGTCVSPGVCQCHFGFVGDNCSSQCHCNKHSNCKGVSEPDKCLECKNNTMVSGEDTHTHTHTISTVRLCMSQPNVFLECQNTSDTLVVSVPGRTQEGARPPPRPPSGPRQRK